MNTCDNKDRLLELLYGLLDENETAQLRVHLQTCAQCQAALREAEGHKRLFSQAALVCENVPPFIPTDFSRPATEPATLSEQSLATFSQTPLPNPPSAPQGESTRPARRAPRWRLLLVLAGVAASLLLAVVLGHGYYTGLSEREGQLAATKEKIADLDAQFAATRTNFQERQKTLPVQLANQSLHVEMSTSNNFDSQAPLSLNFYTTDLIGNPRDSKVKVEVTDETHKKVLRTEELVSEKGKAWVEMPAGLARKSAKVRITARAGQGPPAVAELRPAEPVYLMHLATNKSSYNVKELLFFRTVTLEDYSLKPIATPIALRYSLKDMDGKTVMKLEGETDPGGIGGGEFFLTDDIPSGMYYLEVAAKTGHSIVPQRHQLEIFQESTPQVAFEKPAYAPGEDVNFSVKNDLNSFASPLMISQQRVQGNETERVLLNDRGLSNFRLRKNVNAAQVVVQDNATNRELKYPVPVVPAQLAVGLYPEGGRAGGRSPKQRFLHGTLAGGGSGRAEGPPGHRQVRQQSAL